jgi:uncharacterized membrane protein
MAAGGTGAQGLDTWTSFAQGFFQDYCVSCHNEDMTGDASRDQTQLSVVMGESDAIACGVATAEIRATLDCGQGDPVASQFPAGNGPSPTDEERARLVAWIEAGMPE